MKNGNMPAMPVMDETAWGQHYGLTKREYFAAMAMQGLLASGEAHSEHTGYVTAKASLGLADALLGALDDDQA